MGGTLTKELWSCAGVSTCVCRLVRRLRVVCWWVGVVEPHWGTGSGLVEHTVGSSGHRPPVGGVPGTGRSSDHEPLRRVSSGIGWGRRVWWGSGSLVV